MSEIQNQLNQRFLDIETRYGVQNLEGIIENLSKNPLTLEGLSSATLLSPGLRNAIVLALISEIVADNLADEKSALLIFISGLTPKELRKRSEKIRINHIKSYLNRVIKFSDANEGTKLIDFLLEQRRKKFGIIQEPTPTEELKESPVTDVRISTEKAASDTTSSLPKSGANLSDAVDEWDIDKGW